ncbi:hypothetical protein CULT_2320005 [[Clostridium] ultunense Esp]|nr:hypothetical protein CULT_2320005 [[Clostridium] ultunense Esp]
MTKLTLREEWEVRVADFRASGMTAKARCNKHQLKIHQLWYWYEKFNPLCCLSQKPCHLNGFASPWKVHHPMIP